MEHSSVPNFPLTKAFNPNTGQLLRVRVVVPVDRLQKGQDPIAKAFSVDGALTNYTVFIEANPETYLNKGDVLEVEVREIHESFSRAKALRRLKVETKTKTVLHRKEEPPSAPKLGG